MNAQIDSIAILFSVVTGVLEIRVETVQALLDTASMLQLPDVQRSCSEFLKRQLHPANCLGNCKGIF